MSMEICHLCKQDSTPWFHINGHICQDCYLNCKGGQWISVQDQLPEEHVQVLCFAGGKRFGSYVIADMRFDKGKNPIWYVYGKHENDAGYGCVLFWMPLPGSPV